MSLFTYSNSFPVRTAFGPGFYGVSRLHDDIDRLFGGFFGQPAGEGKAQAEPACVADFLPGMDLASSDKAYAMHVELPGVAPEDLAVKVEDRILTVSGEKKEAKAEGEKKHVAERVYGRFLRRLSLPDDADADAIHASFKDGVLTVEIPRKAPEKPQARSIEIAKG